MEEKAKRMSGIRGAERSGEKKLTLESNPLVQPYWHRDMTFSSLKWKMFKNFQNHNAHDEERCNSFS